MDSEDGSPRRPTTLHRYVYAVSDPANRLDPSGNDDVGGFGDIGSVIGGLASGISDAALGSYRVLAEAARSGGIGYDKVVNCGCSVGDPEPCKPSLNEQLINALQYISIVPRGVELIQAIGMVNLWQIPRGSNNYSQSNSIYWDPFSAKRFYQRSAFQGPLPNGTIGYQATYAGALSPALVLAHELSHTLGLSDSDLTGGPVPAWETPIARQLRQLGFDEEPRPRYGYADSVPVANAPSTGL